MKKDTKLIITIIVTALVVTGGFVSFDIYKKKSQKAKEEETKTKSKSK